VERHQPVEEAARRILAGAVAHLGDQAEIHAGREIGLGRGDDDALHGRIAERPVDAGVELADAVLVQDVHGLARQVPGDRGDAVGIEVVAEDGHADSPSGAT
jgi:hypothetical protein